MEQLINTATFYSYVLSIFLIFGVGSIWVSIIIFIFSDMTICKKSLIAFALGVLLLIPGLHFVKIYGKYNEQIIAIVKPVISENYPDATDFSYSIDEGSFTENDIEYKIQYKKTISNEEKLIVTVKDELSENKNVKALDIPKDKTK